MFLNVSNGNVSGMPPTGLPATPNPHRPAKVAKLCTPHRSVFGEVLNGTPGHGLSQPTSTVLSTSYLKTPGGANTTPRRPFSQVANSSRKQPPQPSSSAVVQKSLSKTHHHQHGNSSFLGLEDKSLLHEDLEGNAMNPRHHRLPSPEVSKIDCVADDEDDDDDWSIEYMPTHESPKTPIKHSFIDLYGREVTIDVANTQLPDWVPPDRSMVPDLWAPIEASVPEPFDLNDIDLN